MSPCSGCPSLVLAVSSSSGFLGSWGASVLRNWALPHLILGLQVLNSSAQTCACALTTVHTPALNTLSQRYIQSPLPQHRLRSQAGCTPVSVVPGCLHCWHRHKCSFVSTQGRNLDSVLFSHWCLSTQNSTTYTSWNLINYMQNF